MNETNSQSTSTEFVLASGGLKRVVSRDGSRLGTCMLGDVSTTSTELAVVLDASVWRSDIEGWRWTRSDSLGVDRGFHETGFDDSGWRRTPHLHPDYRPRYGDWSWFRTTIVVPEEVESEPLTFVIGGMDDEDWTSYRVFLNGEPIGEWTGEGRWREAGRIRLEPGDPRRRNGGNLLALECRGLDRPIPAGLDLEAEHFFTIGWLLDQYVAAGEPTLLVEDFEIREVLSEQSLTAMLESPSSSLQATVTYREEKSNLVRKLVTLRNGGPSPVRVLDVHLEQLSGSWKAPTKGGRGFPVLAGDLFLGIEHPAGVNQGDATLLRATQLFGRTLAAGDELECAPVVLGKASAGQSVEGAFAAYIYELQERPARRTLDYTALGWVDWTNDSDPLPRMTEDLLAENLELLEELQAAGIAFDVYMFNDWWEPQDFFSFNRVQFPSGTAALRDRVQQAGMRSGIWSATTRALWTAHRSPDVDAAIAGGVYADEESSTHLGRDGKWDWDDEFSHLIVAEKRFCWAAEPFRSSLKDALVQHVENLDAGILRLDCTVLHCTSASHNHAPGKYSVQAIVDHAISVAETVKQARPDLLIVWYWGFQSPWWLRWGDLMFDKGLKLEAASPASFPAPSWREGVSVNTDQAIRHARLVPLQLQDNLGVWLGNVAWCNRMGKAGWQDALLLDLARGSALVSIRGNLELLDGSDVAFMKEAFRLARRPDLRWDRTGEVGGDPWLAEPYGYLQPTRSGELVTLSNPSFDATSIEIELSAGAVCELYPFPGAIVEHEGGPLDVQLNPWEIRVLETVDGVSPTTSSDRPRADSARPLDLSALRTKEEEVCGTVRLPDAVNRHDVVAVGARILRNGVWHYHPEPQTLVTLNLALGVGEVWFDCVPTIRSRNGPGCPWVLFRVPAGPAWSGQDLELSMGFADLDGLEIEPFGFVYNAWWNARQHAKTLRLLPWA